MLYSEIKTTVDDLSKLMLERGCVKPRVYFEIEANARPAVQTQWYEHENGVIKLEWHFGDSPEEILDKAETFIRQMPTKDERQRADYRKAVAAAIDLGHKFGIEDAAINPLREVMEKLSKNALEHHPLVDMSQDYEGVTHSFPKNNPLKSRDFDDDIPF